MRSLRGITIARWLPRHPLPDATFRASHQWRKLRMTVPKAPPPARTASPSMSVDEPSNERGHGHAVQFYENEAFLATVVAEFLATGLTAGEPIIVIATTPHCRAFVRQLEE